MCIECLSSTTRVHHSCSALLLIALHLGLTVCGTGCRALTEGKPEQKVLGLVTQSQVLGWLWEQREKEGFPQDIRRLKLKNWKSPVICGTDMLWLVEKETALAEAFHTIKRQRVTGVGVVNEAGELMGNVSASDIKVGVASGKQLLDMLTMSLEQFLTLKGSLMIDIDRPLSHRQPITATPEDTMEQVLEKLITHRIHRLWIVESDGEGSDADISSLAGEQSVPSSLSLMRAILAQLAMHCPLSTDRG
jgi:CBS domain-containing protein